MNIFFQVVAAVASIVSVPLAIYFYIKTSKVTSDKARNDIIRTLSYRLGAGLPLTKDAVASVYSSKLREHKINRPNFGKNDIIDDLESEIMSNPFLDAQNRFRMLDNLSTIDFSIPRAGLDKYKIEFVLNDIIESPILLVSIFLSMVFFLVEMLPIIPEIIDCIIREEPEISFRIRWETIIHSITFPFYRLASLIILLILLAIYAACKIYKRNHVK